MSDPEILAGKEMIKGIIGGAGGSNPAPVGLYVFTFDGPLCSYLQL